MKDGEINVGENVLLPRVLFVNHTGETGGAEFSLLELVTKLPVVPGVVLLSPGPLLGQLLHRGISAWLLDGAEDLVSLGRETSLLFRVWSIRTLPRLMKQLVLHARSYDLIYANSKKALLFACIAARLAGKPLIWHQHDEMRIAESLPFRDWFSERLLVSLLNCYATRIISVSHASAKSFIAAGGRAELPFVVHNGLDPALYALKVDREAVRTAIGLPLDRRIVACFGRLTPWKGQDILIKAISMVSNVHVVFVGGAIFGETDYEANLRVLTERLGLKGRVHFLGHRNDVPRLMKAMDVVVHSSKEFDPCPLVVLEALHAGVPLVATAVGGVPELVKDGVTGLLIPPSDPQALAVAIKRVLDNPDFAARLAAAGCRCAVKRFTLERTVNKVTREIHRCINHCN